MGIAQQMIEPRVSQTGPATEPSTMCLAIIHLSSRSGKNVERRLQSMRRAARYLPGVARVRAAEGGHRMVMIHYLRDETSPSQIVQQLREEGFKAVLVGC